MQITILNERLPEARKLLDKLDTDMEYAAKAREWAAAGGAGIFGDPDCGGVCPGYRRVGLAFRVPGGWWRIKGQAVRS